MAKPSSASSASKGRKPVAVRAGGAGTKRAPRFDGMSGAMTWLMERVDVERIAPSRIDADTLKLDRMYRLVDLLGSPHTATHFVHVAGTKGKGSTCEMAAACLEACGNTVGLYTSPHLFDIRERIRINRKPITQAEFVRVAERVAAAASELSAKMGEATFFELTTAMGLVHFAEEAVDVAVVEVGLGGRLDSTNVISPDVAAITSLSLDHTQILGTTVEKIAAEKAGIFKPGAALVSAPQSESVLEVLRQAATDVGGVLQVVGKEIEFTWRFEAVGTPPVGPHHRVTLSSARNEFDHLAVPLRGEHQVINCGVALAIVDKMSERGFKTPASKVTQGLAMVKMPGRFEMVWAKPRILVDGAHNAASVSALMKTIGSHLSYEAMAVVFGCAGDKDIDGMLRELALAADKVIFTKVPGNARAADPKELSRRFAEVGKISQTADDIGAALQLAAKSVGRDDLICVTGSLYLVAEAKKHLAELAAKKG